MRVLIIKTGYSETVDKEVSKFSSLGDVLRTTVLLHLYKHDIVTWLTDKAAMPLLENNPYISELLEYDLEAVVQLAQRDFDLVINLEKGKGFAALASNIRAPEKKGFWFDRSTGNVIPHDGAQYLYTTAHNHVLKMTNTWKWQELLYGVVGQKWRGEGYILGYKPIIEETHDVGLNYKVGSKWPSKEWSMDKWRSLEALFVKANLRIRWQPDIDLYGYINWINSCKILVSSDSLGPHIALALGKKVVILCGPTNGGEIDLYGRGVIVTAKGSCDHAPCYLPECGNKLCMDFIKPMDVLKAIKSLREENYE